MHTCDSTDMTCLSLAEGAHNAQEIVSAHSSQFAYLDFLPPSWLLVVFLHCFDVLFVCLFVFIAYSLIQLTFIPLLPLKRICVMFPDF